MSNLLDKASIILTPTAYNNGEALCVKPSDGSGDFDFSRNSAATRVNAQGLVENVQILSSNLVQNGDFSEEGAEEVSNGSFSQEGIELITNGNFDTDSDWTKQASWSISGGAANYDFLSDAKYIRQTLLNGGFVAGKTYKINFEITSGTAYMNVNSNGGGLISLNTYSVGSYSIYVTASASGSDLLIYGRNTSGTAFSIDNVSVREVGQNWSLGSGWSIGEDKLNFTNVNGSSNQSSVFVIGKTYKITCDYVFTSGTRLILPYDGSNFNSDMVITTPSSAIGYTYYYTPLGGSASFMYSDGNGNGSITNISVKEVGQNWDLQTGWEIGDGVAIFDYDTSISKIFTSNLNLNLNNSYKLSFEIKNVLSGTPNIFIANSGGSVGYNGNYTNYSEGVHTLIFSPSSNQTTLSFFARYSDFSITNISVIEITDDTNLPRINYEGFSYQDALGSEEVVNGDFATDSDWGKSSNWTISGGTANSNGLSGGIYQNIGLVSGKTYKVNVEVSLTSGSLYVREGNNGSVAETITQSGNYSIYLIGGTATSQVGYIQFYSISFNGSIDNVSVKEYLGQEVVPDSGCGSWLFEPQSTNLITQSEALSTMQIQSTVTDNVLKSPTGNVNASIVVENTALNTHGIQRATIIPTNPSATSYTLSIFAKKKERQYIQLGFFTDGVMQSSSGFDLENGTTSGDANTHKIKDFGNGWYRCSFTKDVVQSGGYNFARVAIGTSLSSFYYTGDGASGLYMFGYQLEQGNISSYIPTSGSSVTRNQDVCTNGGSLASINSTEGVLYFNTATLVNTQTTDTSITLTDGINNILLFRYRSTNQINLKVFVNGVAQTEKTYTLSDATDFNKIAIKWQLNNYKIYVNGVSVFTSGSALVFPNDSINSLSFTDGANNFFGKTKALAVWKEALSDEELTELTTI